MVAIFFSLAAPAWAQQILGTLPVGDGPGAIAVNAATSKIYVANWNANSVTVLDGNTYATSTVAVGANPRALAVDEAANKIYVLNYTSGTVTVIDGDTLNTTTVPVGANPKVLAVNSVTHKIYVPSSAADNVTVIDGATNVTRVIPVGNQPNAVAVNPLTNRVYVTNLMDGTLSVIDGQGDTVLATLPAGTYPWSVAVNVVTNQVFVANAGSATLSVINGATHATTSLATDTNPIQVAVNPVTNKVYVYHGTPGSVIAVDGSSGARLATISTSALGGYLAVDAVTNRVFLSGPASKLVVVIDGATHASTNLTCDFSVKNLAIDPIKARVYVTNTSDDRITLIDNAVHVANTAAGGPGQVDVVVNQASHAAFFVNNMSTTVTVMDGATGATTTVDVGSTPYKIAVNPMTNQAFVACDRDVTVIDGATLAVTHLPVSGWFTAIAVNPVTNRVYAADLNNSRIVEIDGGTHVLLASIPAAASPGDIAVNPVTNRIYAIDYGDGTVRVIDGTTHQVWKLAVGVKPRAIDINTETNKIYIANEGTNNLAIIDGATRQVVNVNMGRMPRGVAVNPVTNRIYVANDQDATVSVMDGATNQVLTTSRTVGGAWGIAVDPLSNRVYVGENSAAGQIAELDGASNITVPLTVGPASAKYRAVAVDHATGTVFAADVSSSGAPARILVNPNPPDALHFNQCGILGDGLTAYSSTFLAATHNASPTFRVAVASKFSATPAYAGKSGITDPTPTQLYVQVDDGPRSSWQKVMPLPPSLGAIPFEFSASSLTVGLHTLRVAAVYGEGAGSTSSSSDSMVNAPVTSRVHTVPFMVLPLTTWTSLRADQNPQNQGRPVTFTAAVDLQALTSAPGGQVVFKDGSTTLGFAPVVNVAGVYQATFTTSSLSAGSHNISATYTGDPHYLGSTSSSLTEVMAGTATQVLLVAGGDQQSVVGSAFPSPISVQVLDANNVPVRGVSVAFGGAGMSYSGSPAVTDASGLASVQAWPTLAGSRTAVASITGASLQIPETGLPASPTLALALASSSGSTTYGQRLTLTATLTPWNLAATSTNGLTVTFKDGSTILGVGTLASGVATWSSSTLAVGPHAFTATFEGDANNNAASSNEVDQAVGKATATVTLGGLAPTYDGMAHAATATTSPAGLAVSFTYDGSPTAPTAAGSYSVVATVNDGNYLGTATGTLVIAKATATVTLGGLASTYDGTAHAATATTSPAGLAVSLTYSGGPTAPTVAGSYRVVATVNDGNYQGSATGTLVIARATATVTLGGLASTYDGTAHAVTATTSPAGLTVRFSYNGSSTAPTAAGSYPVGAIISDWNYQGTTTGTLVIAKATATVTLGGLATTYDGTAHAATATTSPAGMAVSLTYNGSPTAPTAAGTYPVVATISDRNHVGTATGALVIAKATALVTLGDLASTYDGTAHAVTATTSPAGLAVSFTYNGSLTVPTAAGSYPVVATVTDGNYLGTANGTLVIAKATATVTLGGLATTFDGTAHAATATTSPVGLAVSFTYNGSPTAPTVAGSYPVVATVTDGNYLGTATGTLVIAKANASLAMAASKISSVYGDSVTLTATLAGSGGDFSGSVQFLDGAGNVGSAPVVNGQASITLLLPPGSHAMTALYGGDVNTLSCVSPALTLEVAPLTTVTILTVSGGANFGAPATLTAQVLAPAGQPTGTVTFYAGEAALGSVPLTGGTATLSVRTLSVGSHDLHAVYGGDAVDGPSRSKTVALAVGDPEVHMKLAETALSVEAGKVAQGSLTLQAFGTLPGPVLLTVTGLPAHTFLEFSSDNLDPAMLPATVYFQVRTSAHLPTLSQHRSGYGPGSGAIFACSLVGLPFVRRRRRWMIWMGVMLLMVGGGLIGCSQAWQGGDDVGSRFTNTTKPGTYAVTITASSGASIQATATVNLTVTR